MFFEQLQTRQAILIFRMIMAEHKRRIVRNIGAEIV